MTLPAIPDVIAYGLANRHNPLSDELTVVTRTNALEIHHPDLGSLWLTTEQSVNLRERLEQAESDIDAAEPCEDGGALTEPARCDCCGRTMAVGEQVSTFWDERKGDVVMHAGKCPEPEMWVAEGWFHEGEGEWTKARTDTALPYEEAFAAVRDRVAGGHVRSIRLVRVREARS